MNTNKTGGSRISLNLLKKLYHNKHRKNIAYHDVKTNCYSRTIECLSQIKGYPYNAYHKCKDNQQNHHLNDYINDFFEYTHLVVKVTAQILPSQYHVHKLTEKE